MALSFDEFPLAYIDSPTLLGLLKEYTNPRDYIARLVKKGVLIRLKNGVFLIREKIKNKRIPFGQVANFLYGPSYVSLEWALSEYGLIPERVVNPTSMTTGKSKTITTEIAGFSYYSLDINRYDFGVEERQDGDWPGGFLIASKEKALLDYIFVKWKSFTDLDDFLEASRMEKDALLAMDKAKMQEFSARYNHSAIDRFVGALWN